MLLGDSIGRAPGLSHPICMEAIMPCSVCDHTLESIVNTGSVSGWRCPRCGSCKMIVGKPTEAVPISEEIYGTMLVERVRNLLKFCQKNGCASVMMEARRLGVMEAVWGPMERI